jgi:hypothetical protein
MGDQDRPLRQSARVLEMSNTTIMGACAVALACIEVAQNIGIVPFGLAFIGTAITFAILGRALQKKIEGKR